MGRIDSHLLLRALTGIEEECGDGGVIVASGDSCFAALVDVLGHGPEAHKSALAAEEFLRNCAGDDLVEAIQGLHRVLRQGRGAVAALCRLNLDGGELEIAGVGNITARLFGSENSRVLLREGIVGYSMSSPRLETRSLYPGDILMFHSDGIREHFEPHDCRGLLDGTARDIAERVMRHFRKADDDASCLVLRYLP